MTKQSKYKGVNWNVQRNKWRSSVTVKGKKIECGFHDTELEAVKARDKKIIALKLNVELQKFKRL